jgi:hypothetical protein
MNAVIVGNEYCSRSSFRRRSAIRAAPSAAR